MIQKLQTQSNAVMFIVFEKDNRLDICCCVRLQECADRKEDSLLFCFFKKVYAPFILKEWVRPIIVSMAGTLMSILTLLCLKWKSVVVEFVLSYFCSRFSVGGSVCGNALLQYCCGE